MKQYDEYTEARNEMLLASDTVVAPWTIVNSNEKKRARLGALRSVLHGLEYEHKDLDVVGRTRSAGGATGPIDLHRELSVRRPRRSAQAVSGPSARSRSTACMASRSSDSQSPVC